MSQHITFVPDLPLGGYRSLRHDALLQRWPTGSMLPPQRADLAWSLQCSSAIALIPGTSSVAHLRENMAAAELHVPPDAVAAPDAMAE
ncbi:hypothetical protein OG252_50460 [Streptomyces sp. NBC_01352]|uniref:hypothetical protein n=1 Tax=unclassified Streptomyces TaxID=2593676 RepID=UPI002E312F3C|nr:hypothetical protein [Streptomyces sp. NBC_01352]